MPVLVPVSILAKHVDPDAQFERLLINLFNLLLLLLDCVFNSCGCLRNFVTFAIQLINPVFDLARVSTSCPCQNIAQLLKLLSVGLLVLDVNRVKQLLVVFCLFSFQLLNGLVYLNLLLVVLCFLFNSLL